MPHAAFIMKFSAPFLIRSKALEIDRQTRKTAHREENDTEIRMKNREIEDFQVEFVYVLEEHIDSQYCSPYVNRSTRNVQITSFFSSIRNPGEVGI